MSILDKLQDAETLGDAIKALPKKALMYGAAAAGVFMLALGSYHSTGTTEVGVRVRKIGIPFLSQKGVVQESYEPGQGYFFLPVINDWYTLQGGAQSVSFKDGDELRFKTKEGNDIGLELTVFYNIRKQCAPQLIENVGQSDEEIREKIFVTGSRSRVRDYFGLLATEGFFDTEKRTTSRDSAQVGLQKLLDPYCIDVQSINVGDYRYINPTFKHEIQAMKQAQTETEKIRAGIQAQYQANQRRLSEADGIVNQAIADADGKYARDSIAADAQFRSDSITAEAIVTEGRNQAAALRAQRQAMLSAGGRTQVLMAIIDAVKDKPIYMIPAGGTGTVQTLNLTEFMKQFVGVQEALPTKP